MARIAAAVDGGLPKNETDGAEMIWSPRLVPYQVDRNQVSKVVTLLRRATLLESAVGIRINHLEQIIEWERIMSQTGFTRHLSSMRVGGTKKLFGFFVASIR